MFFQFLIMMTANGWYKSELDIDLQNDYYDFLNGFQFASLSFRDFDKIIFIRPYLVSWLGSSNFWSVYNLHYDSGSVLANFLNFFILIGILSLFRTVSYLLKRRSRNSKNESLYTKAHSIVIKLAPVEFLFDIALMNIFLNWITELISQLTFSQLDRWFSYITSDIILALIIAYKVLYYK